MSLSEKLSRRIELFRDEVAHWQDAHAEAMACLELQDALTFGLWLHQQINSAEAQWYAAVDAGRIPFSEAEETAIAKLYSLWLIPCQPLLVKLARFELAGFQVDRAAEFRDTVEQARYSAWDGPLSPEEMERVQHFQSLSTDERNALVKSHPPAAEWFDEPDWD